MLSKILLSTLFISTVYFSSSMHYVNKKLASYFDNYTALVNEVCKPTQYHYPPRTIITFADLDNGTNGIIGLCSYLPNRWTIYIDRSFFRDANEEERNQLMSHELRHCLFDVGHSTDENNYMAPLFPHLTTSELYNQIYDDLYQSCGQK